MFSYQGVELFEEIIRIRRCGLGLETLTQPLKARLTPKNITRGVALLEEVSYWGWAFLFQKFTTDTVSLSLSLSLSLHSLIHI